MIKLLALDMDGTLLNEAKEIPQAHITAIHQAIEKGVKLVLCTGRPLFGVLPYYKKLGLDLQFSGVRSQPVIYEAMPLGTTKATALSRLAAILKIEPSEIMAMGDANNDIEMLQFAGLGIAMGNASDHVKSLANDVTTSNEEDGVARAIEKYIL